MKMIPCWLRLAGLSVALLCSGVYAQEQPAASNTTTQTPATPEPASSDTQEAMIEPVDVRDPFVTALPKKYKPPSETVNETAPGEVARKTFAPEQYKVSGLVWGIEKAKAIINDQIVGIGDVINDATIKRIDKEGILVEFDGQEYLLKRESGGSPGGGS